ncbi:hypothetical protein ACXX9E_29335 [Pseudomonas sp. GNP014]
MISNSSPPGCSGPAPSCSGETARHPQPARRLSKIDTLLADLMLYVMLFGAEGVAQHCPAHRGIGTLRPPGVRRGNAAQRPTRSRTAAEAPSSSFQDIEAFARLLLLKVLREQYQVQVDVDNTLLCLAAPTAGGQSAIELSSSRFWKLSMLQRHPA